jgi:hypothetical protein
LVLAALVGPVPRKASRAANERSSAPGTPHSGITRSTLPRRRAIVVVRCAVSGGRRTSSRVGRGHVSQDRPKRGDERRAVCAAPRPLHFDGTGLVSQFHP